MIKANEVEAMKKSIGIGTGNSFTIGANTVTDRAMMLQIPIAVALFLDGKMCSSPKLAL
jgi:hypothetical protein